MQVTADTVVGIDYTLKDQDGNVVDSNQGKAPLYYLHGHQNIVAGLEEALEGHAQGDQLDIQVPPEKGYGTRNEQLVFEVPKNQLPKQLEPQKGMLLEMRSEKGDALPVMISDVQADSIKLDANHQLADKTLHFSVTVRDIRKASAAELQEGRVQSSEG